jgi:hypothetical protein
VEEEFKIPVLSVVQLKHLIFHIQQSSEDATHSELVKLIENYRAQYGVNY